MAEKLITFKKPYKFEDKEYTELDMSGLNKLTVQDVIDVQKSLQNSGNTAAMVVMETTAAFAMELAVKATKKPVEFYKLMPRWAFNQVQNAVMEALGSENRTVENHVVKFDTTYIYDGKKAEIKGESYDSVDLAGVEDLCVMNEITAENRMAAQGFTSVNKTRNYVYIASIAGMASGLPEDFFTGLPLCEALKLVDAVNTDFFD